MGEDGVLVRAVGGAARPCVEEAIQAIYQRMVDAGDQVRHRDAAADREV
jgi:hypothetical protein